MRKKAIFENAAGTLKRNPLRAGIVKNAEEYLWSSYHFYAHGKKDELVDEDPYYRGLGGDDAARQRYYRNFINLKGPYDGLMDEVLVERHF